MSKFAINIGQFCLPLAILLGTALDSGYRTVFMLAEILYIVMALILAFSPYPDQVTGPKKQEKAKHDFKPVANFYAAGELVGGANGKDSITPGPTLPVSWLVRQLLTMPTTTPLTLLPAPVMLRLLSQKQLPAPSIIIANNSQIFSRAQNKLCENIHFSLFGRGNLLPYKNLLKKPKLMLGLFLLKLAYVRYYNAFGSRI